jgi:hypothetical protein
MRSTAAACLAGAFAAAAVTTAAPVAAHGNPAPTAPVSAAEAREIAIEAYTYAYPIVLMELTRRVGVNTEVASPGGMTPMNQFSQRPAFPDASFTNVVRPNADTLYSIQWFDVAKEPLVIGVPDSGGRYYLLQMLDMWSDTFAVPGSRTTGDKAQLVVLAGPG